MTAPATLLDAVRMLPAAHRVTADLTASDVCVQVQASAADLRDRGVREGEPGGLWLPNGDTWVLAFLALLAAGASPLLIAPETPAAERGRLLARGAASRWVTSGRHQGEFRLAGSADNATAASVPPGQRGGGVRGVVPPGQRGGGVRGVVPPGQQCVLLPTSGSTGRPALVRRDEASLLAEAARYRQALSLDGRDRLLLPLPLSHAYALGWLAAALVTGTRVRALPPTALNAIAAELCDGATIVALVPTLARLLAARQLARPSPAPAPAVRAAMVGAGPVDEALERAFSTAFGVATARNYGSTETGALFCGLPALPPLGIGGPMPGVGFQIVDGDECCPPGSPGVLKVRLGREQAWRDTKDLAVLADGHVLIMGRRHQAIRHGARWVAPLEVAAALREHPKVRDVHVWSRPGDRDGDDILVADVEAADPGGLSAADLARFARGKLAPFKVPKEIRITEQLTRTPAGKVAAPRRYRLAANEVVLAASRAYRTSELLFALRDLGALEALEKGASAGELAALLGARERELDWLLGVAASLGVVSTDDDCEFADDDQQHGRTDGPGALTAFIELESILSGTWLSRDALTDAVRAGVDRRRFERTPTDGQLIAAYSGAMHDAFAWQRTALCLRLTRRLRRQRVVEVSAGPGRYLSCLLAADPSVTGCLVRLGRLSGALAPPVREAVADGRIELRDDPPGGDFDLCVVTNGIHGPSPGSDLSWLLDRLHPAGALVVDDVFLPAEGGPGSELGLDWLTHGGIAWPSADGLAAGILAAGWQVDVRRRLGTSHCHVLLATGG
jgi:long-chain acyl-CoA synthetase